MIGCDMGWISFVYRITFAELKNTQARTNANRRNKNNMILDSKNEFSFHLDLRRHDAKNVNNQR